MRTESVKRRWTPRLVASHIAIYLVALAFLAPLIYTVATSLKPNAEVFATPPSLVGSELRWDNYAEAMTILPFGRFIANGLLVAVAGTLLTLVAASLSGFAFARLRFRGREAVFLLFLATLMVPQEVLVVPMSTMMQQFGWVDSFPGLIVPWAFTAFGTFLMRQFFRGIPVELDEAAKLDGMGPVRIFLRIALPLARPALATLAVFSFISYWNSFLWPLIITNSVEQLGTVPVGLSLFFGQQANHWNLVMAASVISMIPTVLLLVLLQKHLVRGVATTGLAGR